MYRLYIYYQHKCKHVDISDEGLAGHLIVAADNKVVKQDLANLFSDPEVIYEDPDESVLITGKLLVTYLLSFLCSTSTHFLA
jgi:hypothetical protein